MSVLDGKPAYPNSKTDFEGVSRVTRTEDGQLLVKNPYGGNAVAVENGANATQAVQSPYINRAAYPRDYSQVGTALLSKGPASRL